MSSRLLGDRSIVLVHLFFNMVGAVEQNNPIVP